MSAIAVFAGDFHCGSSLGLQPPVVRLDDGQVLRHSRYQAFIWRCWMAFWKEIAEEKARRGAPVVFFANGELCDNNWHKTVQMSSRNLADLMKLALQAFVPARRVADDIIVLRGTEAHSGSGGALDELMAERLAPLVGVARWIVIDCAPHLGPLEPAVFGFADWVVAPVQLQFLSAAGVSQHTETLDRLIAQEGARSKLAFIVPTMVSLRDGRPWQNGERQMMEAIVNAYGRAKVLAPIPDSVLVEQSPGVHQSIFEFAPATETPVRAYANLVERVYHVG